MRAMHNLALVLRVCGDREAAASLADRILRLNPNDNQGIRYLALAWHPVLGNWPRVEALLKKYRDDGGADYLYARCLDRFRQGRDAEGALDDAMEENPHVPALLLAATLRHSIPVRCSSRPGRVRRPWPMPPCTGQPGRPSRRHWIGCGARSGSEWTGENGSAMKKLTGETKPAAKSILSVIAPPDIRKAVAIPLPGETAEERKRRDEVFFAVLDAEGTDRPILRISR